MNWKTVAFQKIHRFQPNDPTDTGLFFVLLLGRILGAIPFSFSFKPYKSVTLRYCSLSALHTFALTFLSIIIQFPQVWGGIRMFGSHRNILEELAELEEPLFSVSLTTAFIFFTKNSRKLLKILRQISTTFRDLDLKSKDSTFPWFCVAVSLVVLGIGASENALWHTFAVQKEDESFRNKSIVEKLYTVEAVYIRDIVPNNVFFHLLLFYLKKVGSYTWNFGDIFLIVLCRAVSHKFKELNMEICEVIEGMESVNLRSMEKRKLATIFHLDISNHHCFRKSVKRKSQVHGHVTWEMIRLKVMQLCRLGDVVGRFVTPLVLACYGYNIFFIILNSLRFFFDPNWESDRSVYIYMSIFQFGLRVVLVTYSAGQLYHSTDTIVKTLEYCPESCFSETAARLERMLRNHPVGVTIFGSIRVTNKFFVSIVNFRFTMEIVLLQAMSAAQLRLRSNNST